MNFGTAVSTCLSNFATFKGRASRSEYWWFYLFTLLLTWGSILVGTVLGDSGVITNLVTLIFLIPALAAGSRRLHDIERSGWWQLLTLTIIGGILLLVWLASGSKKESNKYGEYVPA